VLFFIVAAYNFEEEGAIPVEPGIPVPAGQRSTVAPLTLTGGWRDAEGGNYQVVQQGGQVAVQGLGPHGAVNGGGMLQGNQLSLEYVVNGYPYQAVLQVSPDGLTLVGQYRGMTNGERGQVHLQRSQ
jgi:hypothetical protein